MIIHTSTLLVQNHSFYFYIEIKTRASKSLSWHKELLMLTALMVAQETQAENYPISAGPNFVNYQCSLVPVIKSTLWTTAAS